LNLCDAPKSSCRFATQPLTPDLSVFVGHANFFEIDFAGPGHHQQTNSKVQTNRCGVQNGFELGLFQPQDFGFDAYLLP
jgi:hypothetical protein